MQEMIYLRAAWRSQWKSIVFTIGLFVLYFINTDPLLSPYILGVSVFFSYRILVDHYKTKYMIGPKGIEIHVGIISQDMTRLEYRHIRGANMKASLMNRMLGIGHITLSTSGMDEDIQIKNIKNTRYFTDLIINRLKELD